jgi:NAD+ dependent glucose-6-phosphate dehydrogenase
VSGALLTHVALTGASGTVGSVVREQLGAEVTLVPLDLPETDLRDYDTAAASFDSVDAVIHLAWNTATEHYRSGRVDPANALMIANVYRAAQEAGVRRVVMASSVHADDFYAYQSGPLLSASALPVPTSPYGATKVFCEALGRHYARRGLEVVCLRLGGVNSAGRRPDDEWEARVWLAHEDLCSLVRHCLVDDSLASRFQVVYAVSDNAGRVHDTSNSLGWATRPYAQASERQFSSPSGQSR